MNKKIIIIFLISFAYNMKLNYIKKPTYIEELKLYWGNKCYHIHHWITFSVVIGLILIGMYAPRMISYIIIAMSLGSIAEDFLYNDIFILKENCTNIV
jgi:hypothetical protein